MTESPAPPIAQARSGTDPAGEWQRLSTRVIWVDLVRSILSSLPVIIAVQLFGVDPGGGELWPLIGFAIWGIAGAIHDTVRWVFTRYRITASYVEMTSGVFLRKHRSIQRDRIRTVDIEAKLRHRLSGLRVVTIGAGQQTSAGESALALDALGSTDAQALWVKLLSPAESLTAPDDLAEEHSQPAPPDRTTPQIVFARFQPGWVIYNMFNVWAYVFALGVGWGAFWLLGSFGVDVTGFMTRLLDWESIGWVGGGAIALGAISIFGALGLAANYFTEYWDFELSRVPGPEGSTLRTRHGLFSTREVNRDENRIRGIQISEPLLWRWMGVSDTTVISTGLNMWSLAQPAAILPRGPVSVARRVAAEVLGAEKNPFDVPLAKHPPAALLRRLSWAIGLTAGISLLLISLAMSGVLPSGAIWVIALLAPLTLGAAAVAYRALGHAIVGPYLVARSGLFNRSTIVLQRSSVSTIVIRESLLQRRLGLQTVSAMTAAGYGGYDVPDLDAQGSVSFALQAAPGLLDPFIVARGTSQPTPDEA